MEPPWIGATVSQINLSKETNLQQACTDQKLVIMLEGIAVFGFASSAGGEMNAE
jgi:hypothetical protein